MKLIFASNNKGKITEVQSLVPDTIEVVSLKDAGIFAEIPEPFHTFKENAWAKADYIYQSTGTNCFAEDSGLVVPALNGAPGVYSARYAGEPSDDEANNAKLMDALQAVQDTSAWYQSVICLILKGDIYYFEGKCEGHLVTTPRGSGGFGYDPLFVPVGFDRTFGEIPLVEKNKISHRGAAMKQFAQFLNNLPS